MRRKRGSAVARVAGGGYALLLALTGCSGRAAIYEITVVAAGGAETATGGAGASSTAASNASGAPTTNGGAARNFGASGASGSSATSGASGSSGASTTSGGGGIGALEAGSAGAGTEGDGGPPARATSRMTIVANLDADAAVPTLPFDMGDPASTSNFSTSITLFAENGDTERADVWFAKTADRVYDYHVSADGEDFTPPQKGYVEIGWGTLTFTINGALFSNQVVQPVSVEFEGNSSTQSIDVDFGSPIAIGGTGLDGTTEFGSPANVSEQSQDGYGDGGGQLGAHCVIDNACISRSCVQNTCFCGEGCACRYNEDCSNTSDLCVNRVCTYQP